MWSIPVLIVVAVLGASLLFATGTMVMISILRRRDRHLMQRHGVNGNLAAYHRSRLSATENNYAHIPAPNAPLRRNAHPESLPAIWNTIPSEEHLQPADAPQRYPENELFPLNAKRRKSFRASVYGQSFHAPKTRRQKKIEKTISLKQLPRSPLSAITEFTDSTDGPAIAELPTEHTPSDTRAKADESRSSAPQPLPVAKTRGGIDSMVQRQSSTNNRLNFTRSVSMGSTASNAPDEPLPPLPTFDIYKHRISQAGRTSTASIDTTGSSLFGTFMSSPSHAETDLTVPMLNSEMQTFDFGFADGRGSTGLGIPPGRQTLTGYCAGKSGINSIRPSVDFNAGRSVSTGSAQQDSLQMIDARNWNPSPQFGFRLSSRPASAATRHSMQDYRSILGRRDQYSELIDHAERVSPPPRPSSVPSRMEHQWDLKPAFAPARHSVGSGDSSRKGHKRQNCIRITNLPAVEARDNKVGLPDLAEEQPETSTTSKVKIPGLSLLEAGQPVLRARQYLVDVKGSPSPMQNRPILLPSRPRRSTYYRTSTSPSGFPRPNSDVFSTAQPSPTTPIMFQSARQLPLSPTPSTSIKMNSNTPPLHDSPTLPSPIKAGHRRKSLVKGPRNLPTSDHPSRTGSPSPGSQKYAQKKTVDGLRKSVAMLRCKNSEGRLLDHSSRNYRSIGAAGGDDAMASNNYGTMSNLSLFPTTDRRTSTAAFGQRRSKMSIAVSPSNMSVGATSIWEDESVRADSPEPDLPTLKPEMIAHKPRMPRMKIPYSDPEAYENVASHSKGFKDRKYTSPQGKGLGIVGPEGRVIGTPESLYDGDGFLKD